MLAETFPLMDDMHVSGIFFCWCYCSATVSTKKMVETTVQATVCKSARVLPCQRWCGSCMACSLAIARLTKSTHALTVSWHANSVSGTLRFTYWNALVASASSVRFLACVIVICFNCFTSASFEPLCLQFESGIVQFLIFIFISYYSHVFHLFHFNSFYFIQIQKIIKNRKLIQIASNFFSLVCIDVFYF